MYYIQYKYLKRKKLKTILRNYGEIKDFMRQIVCFGYILLTLTTNVVLQKSL